MAAGEGEFFWIFFEKAGEAEDGRAFQNGVWERGNAPVAASAAFL
jgi:hypothetical protein